MKLIGLLLLVTCLFMVKSNWTSNRAYNVFLNTGQWRALDFSTAAVEIRALLDCEASCDFFLLDNENFQRVRTEFKFKKINF